VNTWQALYLKELKDNRGVFAFVLLAALCLGAYAVVASVRTQGPTPGMALGAVGYLMSLVLPFLLIHSFSQEVRGQTHYLLLSLPVPHWHLVLAKFAAVLTGSAALFAVSTAFVHAILLDLAADAAATGAAPHSQVFHVSGLDLWTVTACVYFSVTVLLLGIGTLISGVRLMVRRLQGILSVACFGACLYVYGYLFEPAVSGLGSVGLYEMAVIDHGQVEHVEPQLQALVYSCAMGLLFLGLGTWLIDKRVEV